jgi:hypothetical protein
MEINTSQYAIHITSSDYCRDCRARALRVSSISGANKTWHSLLYENSQTTNRMMVGRSLLFDVLHAQGTAVVSVL